MLRGSHKDELQFPADLYLEGSDQHRGWFHSSLLTSSMLNGTPPYKALLTHGFTVDGEGKKMSKSLGNTLAPQKISDSLGAEILRLWVASTDYSGELSISDEILKRVVESYRRIRNTLRFLLANTSDFDPAKDAVPIAELLEIDRYAIARMAQLQAEITQHYEVYEFHPVVAKLQMYCSEDLGGFYLDILKDRLYTGGATSQARRSAQTAIWHITQSLLRVMAPILTFTVEEAWPIFAGEQAYAASDETIFTQTWHALPEVAGAAALLDKYAQLLALRADVTKQLEEVRMAGGIGSSLQAEVEIKAAGDKYALLAGLGDDLKFILITSQAKVTQVANCRGRSGAGDAVGAAEVRALLALPRRCRRPCRTCGHLRTLRCQPVRRRRVAQVRLITRNLMAKKSGFSGGGNSMMPWLGIASIVLLLDQLSKIVITRLFVYGESLPVTSFFNLVLVYNKGAAFSFLASQGGWQRWFFTVLGIVAALFIVYLLKRHAGQRMFCWALALILGGAIGNVIDRIAYGHVIDFLDFHVAGWHWPAFNVADSAICVGAVLFVLDELRRVKK